MVAALWSRGRRVAKVIIDTGLAQFFGGAQFGRAYFGKRYFG
jgi:hypothetical protein